MTDVQQERAYLRPGSAPLAGRGAELRLLDGLLEQAAAGEAQLGALVGEPGVGKTRLLAEVTRAARAAHGDWRVLRGGAYEMQDRSPYQPFLEALREALDELGPAALRRLAGPWAAQLGRLLPELRPPRWMPPPEEPAALLEAWAQLVRRLAAKRPVLLVLDDLQWADSACLELLIYLRRRLRSARLLLLVAAREPEPGSDLEATLAELNRQRLLVSLRLRPLAAEDTAALLAGLLGATAPASRPLLELVQRQSEGNPFIAEELVRALAEQGWLARSDAGWELRAGPGQETLPPGVRDAVRLRLRPVPAETLALLQSAAVLGRRFAAADLASLADMPESLVAERLDDALRRQLLHAGDEPDGYAFSHDALRETLYLDLTPSKRRELHRRAAERLAAAGEERVADAAYHFLRSPQPERALPSLLAAGERAFAACAYRDAAEHYLAAVELLRRGPAARAALAAALLRLGEAQASAGRYDEALASYGDALSAPGGAELAGELYDRIGRIHLAREEPGPAEQALRRALEALDPAAEPARARVLLCLGQLYVTVSGRLESGAALLEQARSSAARLGDAALEAEALSQLGQAALHRGDFAAGRECFEAALALAERLGDPGLTGLASDGLARQCYWTASFQALRAVAQRELGYARRTGDPQRLGWPTFWLSQAALHLPDWREARQCAETLVRLGEELGARRFLAQGHQQRGMLALLRGELGPALAELELAVEHFRAIGPAALIYYLGPYCQALLRSGRAAEAERGLEELLALAAAAPPGSSPRVQAYNQAALLLLWLGQPERAQPLAAELLPAARQLHWNLLARTLGLLALSAGRWAEAAEHLALAEELARQGGGRVELAETLSAQAQLARRRGETPRAEALSRQAAELGVALGARLGPRLPEPGLAASRAAPAGLSPRELDVVRLVAQGRTNREIASALVISEKTAINHLTHVFDKLCVALHSGREYQDDREHGGGRCLNRAGLVAWAIREGIESDEPEWRQIARRPS